MCSIKVRANFRLIAKTLLQNEKKPRFSARMKQSLDAARAVDTAYLAKERQNQAWVLIYTHF